MKAVALCYHDAVTGQAFDASGFPGASAASYKLSVDQMRQHFAALAALRGGDVARVDDADGSYPLLLTFDDGGVSAITHTADLLEAHGWKGHFLITAKQIGERGFLDDTQIRELHQRGHVIGSHSWSHPARMSYCDDATLHDEWQRSNKRLADSIGEAITVASVPGGFFSRRVAEVAAATGIRMLFTSEPEKNVQQIGDCRIFGRYSVQRSTSPDTVMALAAREWNGTQLGQFALWNGKKLLKTVGGNAWFAAREMWWRQSIKRNS